MTTQTTTMGHEHTLYRATDFGTPVWVECDEVLHVRKKRSANKLTTSRRTNKHNGTRQGKKSNEVTVITQYRAGDADREAFDDAFDNETVLVLGIFDGDVTVSGTKGEKGQYIVVDVDEPNDDDKVNEYTYTFALADDVVANEPTRMTIA